MAYKNKVITNPKTRQTITFLQTAQDTNAKLLEMETVYNSFSKEPVPHYHPLQEEKFTVIEGEINVRIGGEVKVLKKGEKITISPGTIHSMWNNTNEKAVLNWRVQPALNTEAFLENAFGLVNDDKTNEDGMPPILQVALLANRFSLVFRLAKPSYTLQRLIFILLTPAAYLAGYKPTYPKYIN